MPIQISSWNIHGYKYKILNNKLNDLSFLKEIESDDIVSLVETHNSDIDDQLCIPGFKRIKIKNRDSTRKASGGIACFAKAEIFGSIVPINNDNKDTVWFKIKKTHSIRDGISMLAPCTLVPIKIIMIVPKKYLTYLKKYFHFKKGGGYSIRRF